MGFLINYVIKNFAKYARYKEADFEITSSLRSSFSLLGNFRPYRVCNWDDDKKTILVYCAE